MEISAMVISKLWILGNLLYTHGYILIGAEGRHFYFIIYIKATFHANLF